MNVCMIKYTSSECVQNSSDDVHDVLPTWCILSDNLWRSSVGLVQVGTSLLYIRIGTLLPSSRTCPRNRRCQASTRWHLKKERSMTSSKDGSHFDVMWRRLTSTLIGIDVIFETFSTSARKWTNRVETGVRTATICVRAFVDVDTGARVRQKHEADFTQTAITGFRLFTDVAAASVVVLTRVHRWRIQRHMIREFSFL